jgi:TetR/AcrR family transcriptional regulator, transcriptional repressor of aconitase
MPRITEERREARREQIIDAARACVQEHGLEAVSMEMIITRSGLSTGAVYRYFKGKDEVMSAAVAAGLDGLSQALAPVLANPDPPPLPEFAGQVIAAGLGYAEGHSGIDLMLVAVHGWSHVQTVPELKAMALTRFQSLRERFAAVVKKWQAAGTLDPQADPHAMAQLILSISLGFIAQRALAGDADPAAHVAALAALAQTPAG